MMCNDCGGLSTHECTNCNKLTCMKCAIIFHGYTRCKK